MEKYTKWRDAGTGVAPFLPVAPPEFSTYSLPFRVLTFVFKSLVFLIFGFLFVLVDSFFRFSLGSFSMKAFEALRSATARVLLFVMGFYRIPISYDNRKVTRPKNGDLVVANSSSPIDILLLTYLYPSALFTRCDNEMLFETQSAATAFFSRAFFSRVRKGITLSDLRRQYPDRVVILFPECTTSNNRGILAFCPVMMDEAFVMSIKYNNPPYLTTSLPGHLPQFFWSLASVWTHGCRLKGSSQKIEFEHADALARFARLPRTTLGIDEKVEFLKAWNRR